MKPRTSAVTFAALASLTVAMTGCADDIDESHAEESAYGTRNEEGAVATTEKSVPLLAGYNPIFDRSLPSCLTVRETGKPYEVSELWGANHSELVNDANQVQKELNLNIGFGVKVGAAELHPSFGILNRMGRSRLVANFALRAVRGYDITSSRDVILSKEAVALMKKDPSAFLKTCGSGYVRGLQYQADLLVNFRFEATSTEKYNAVTAGLQGQGQVGPVTFDPGVKAVLKNLAKMDGVRASVDVSFRGFDPGAAAVIGIKTEGKADVGPLPADDGQPSADDSDGAGLGITDETFSKIDALVAAMQASIAADARRDGIEPGYEKNFGRANRLASVVVRGYEGTTTEVPYAAFRKNTDLLGRTEQYLASLGEIGDQMTNALVNEIEPVLAAGPKELPLYNVKGKPRQTTAEVLDHAKKFGKAFGRDMGILDSSPYKTLTNLALECSKYGLTGDYSKCETTPKIRNALREPMAVLDAYKAERLVRLNFAATKSMSESGAQSKCKRIAGLGEKSKLVSFEDVALVSPYLRTQGGDDTWFSGGSCGGAPFFDADATGSAAYQCFDPAWFNIFAHKSAIGICVPAEGLVADLPEL